MSQLCQWLHKELEPLPFIRYPFGLDELPENGIYFFYERGAIWGHGGEKPRIVRIGTHREGNFRSRIGEHFLLDESKMDFDRTRPPPHDRSIFRKHIGRALLRKENDPYLEVWNIDFMEKAVREKYAQRRDIEKEKKTEAEVTRILRENFSFRYVALEGETRRMGSEGLESLLIGTVAHCKLCRPSREWLGNHSPTQKIRESGLWLVQHLSAQEMREKERKAFVQVLKETKEKVGPAR